MKTYIAQSVGVICWLVSAAVAGTSIGDKGTMTDSCHSSETDLRRLCSIVNEYFKAEQDEYIYLGGEFYLVSAPNTARVAQGIYVVNTNTDQLVMYGGYGLPSFGEPRKLANGSLIIGHSQSSMSRGGYWKSENVLQVRTNPLTKTPYLLKQEVSALIDGSEELQSLCADEENKHHPDCAETKIWGKNIRVSTGDRSSASLLKAHSEALTAYKGKRPDTKAPYAILESAGVRSILEKKPDDMTLQQYVNLLNDYAFFAYQYMEGRNNLSIEILDKVIRLSPERTPAYLNMAQALEHLAKYASSRYADMPLGPETIERLKAGADSYMIKYQNMKEGNH